MAKINHAIDRVLDLLETYLCGILFFITCTIIFIQVVFRSVDLPVAWTEEIARYLCIWVIYLAASKGVKNGNHMSVDLLPIVLKGKARVVLYIIAELISLAFFCLLCYVGAGRMIIRALQRLVVLVRQLLGFTPLEESESDKVMKQGGDAE